MLRVLPSFQSEKGAARGPKIFRYFSTGVGQAVCAGDPALVAGRQIPPMRKEFSRFLAHPERVSQMVLLEERTKAPVLAGFGMAEAWIETQDSHGLNE
jgi:hypothetical protein